MLCAAEHFHALPQLRAAGGGSGANAAGDLPAGRLGCQAAGVAGGHLYALREELAGALLAVAERTGTSSLHPTLLTDSVQLVYSR